MQRKHLVLLPILLAAIATCAYAQLLDFTLEPNILSNREIQLNYGQSIELVARISGPKLLEAKGITLAMKIADTGETRYFSKISYDTFKLNMKMPEDKRLSKIVVAFELKADIGQPISTVRRINIELTDELSVRIIEPEENPFVCGPIKTIKAKIAYKNNAPFEKDKLVARLIVDGAESTVTLLKEGDLYVAELYEPIPEGNHDIAIVLFGNYSGSSSVKTKQCIWPVLLILVALVVFSVVGFRVFLSRLKKASEEGMRKRVSAEEVPKKEGHKLEEVRLSIFGKKPKPVAETETKPKIEEVVVEQKPKPKQELPFALPKSREGILEIKEEKPREEVIVTKERPPYKPEIEHKTVIEMEPEKKEEKRPSRLFPFVLPKRKVE